MNALRIRCVGELATLVSALNSHLVAKWQPDLHSSYYQSVASITILLTKKCKQNWISFCQIWYLTYLEVPIQIKLIFKERKKTRKRHLILYRSVHVLPGKYEHLFYQYNNTQISIEISEYKKNRKFLLLAYPYNRMCNKRRWWRIYTSIYPTLIPCSTYYFRVTCLYERGEERKNSYYI